MAATTARPERRGQRAALDRQDRAERPARFPVRRVTRARRDLADLVELLDLRVSVQATPCRARRDQPARLGLAERTARFLDQREQTETQDQRDRLDLVEWQAMTEQREQAVSEAQGQPELVALQARVARLEQRVSELAARLDRLEQRVSELQARLDLADQPAQPVWEQPGRPAYLERSEQVDPREAQALAEPRE